MILDGRLLVGLLINEKTKWEEEGHNWIQVPDGFFYILFY